MNRAGRHDGRVGSASTFAVKMKKLDEAAFRKTCGSSGMIRVKVNEDPPFDFEQGAEAEREFNASVAATLQLLRGVPVALLYPFGDRGIKEDSDLVIPASADDAEGGGEEGIR